MNLSRKTSIFLLVFFLLLVSTTISFAEGVWSTGKISNKPWKNGQYYIGINNTKYMIMPNCQLYLRTFDHPGTYREKSISINKLREGQRVEIKAQGFSIYQLVVNY